MATTPRGTPPAETSPRAPAFIPETGKSRSEDMDVQPESSMILSPVGDVDDMERSDLKFGEEFQNISHEAWMKQWTENMNFAKDEMLVVVADSSNEGDDLRPYVAVNGDVIYFQRGVPTKCRRYHVEALARAQTRKVITHDTNDVTRADRYKVIRQSTLKYPFEVIQDPRGALGRKWLQDVLRQQ